MDSGTASALDSESKDAQLIGRIADGDRLALDMLYRRYFPRIARFLDRLIRNAPLLEEVINDTMLVVWQKAHTYDHRSKVSTWIFAIAYRKALKALHSLDEPVEFEPDQWADDAARDPEREMAQRETRQLVITALDALSVEQRAVVCLVYYHSMGYDDIAEIVGCPVNTVKTRIFHARRRLRVLLADKMEERHERPYR